jgi:hypothetical protein
MSRLIRKQKFHSSLDNLDPVLDVDRCIYHSFYEL